MWRRWRRSRALGFVVAAEQIAEEAGGAFRLLLELLDLCAGVGELFLRLVEGVLLDEHGLGEDVERVGIAAEGLLKELLGVEVLLGKLGLVDALDEALKHLLFLRGHENSSMVLGYMTRTGREG